MPIAVVCPGCKAQFRVSEKFAGKTGPCPKCKAKIVIPAATPEVKIHAPEAEVAATVGKDKKGRILSDPVPRFEETMSTQTMVLIGAGTLTALILAFFLGRIMTDSRPLLAGIGLAVVSIPLVLAGYRIFHEEEAEPHSGKTLYLRSAICAAIYCLLWGAYCFVPQEWFIEYWSWFYIAPPFLLLGAITAFASLDLDLGNGFFHYCLFLAATLLFRYLIGMGHLWTT